MTQPQQGELCGYGCGRKWNEEGDENGFDDCVSSYHIKKVQETLEQFCTGIIAEALTHARVNPVGKNASYITKKLIDEIYFLKSLWQKEAREQTIELCKEEAYTEHWDVQNEDENMAIENRLIERIISKLNSLKQ